MPIGSTVVYNPGDLILHNVSSSGDTFQEVKIAAATSSLILFNNNGLLTSQSLNATTVGTSSYLSASSAIITNLTASNISASATGSFGIVGIGTSLPAYALDVTSGTGSIGYLTVGSPTDITTRNQMLNLNIGSNSGATGWIGFNRTSGTNLGMWIGFNPGNTNTFGIQSPADAVPTITISGTGTANSFKTISFGSGNGQVSTTTNFYNMASINQDNIAIRLATTTGPNTNPAITFAAVASAGGTVNDLAKISGLHYTNFASGSQIGGLGFHVTSGSGAFTQSMTLTPTGYVGIGITNPQYTLDVSGSVNVQSVTNTPNAFAVKYANGNNILVVDTSGSSGRTLQIHAPNQNPNVASFYNDTYSITVPVFEYFGYNTGEFRMGTPAGKGVGLYVNNQYTSPQFYLTSSGNVGIGLTNPVNKLDVAGNISASNITASLFFGTSSWATQALTASYVTGVSNVSSSYATSASYSLSASYAPGGTLTGGTTNYIPLWTGTSTLSSSTIYQTGSNIGIGLTTPNSPVHISSSLTGQSIILNIQSAGQTPGIQLTGTDRSAAIYPSGRSSGIKATTLDLWTDNAAYVNFYNSNGTTNYGYVGQRSATVFGITSTVDLQLGASSSTQVFISGSGNVGIGTTNPINKLDVLGNISASNITASLFFGTSSWSNNSLTASSLVAGNSYTITNLTASNISASGNTILNTITASSLIATNGPLIVTGSNAYLQLFPVGGSPVPNNTTASYIYTSGSTNDLYFTQYNGPYTNTTRLRWLEGNLYTGIENGGILSSTPGSNTFNVSSGSGIIVAMNATVNDAPYPTIKSVNWPTITNIPITNSGSSYITYVGIDSGSNIIQQTNSWGSTDINQWDNSIFLGVVLTLSGSVSTGVYNSPQVSYGQFQQQDDFIRSFGPLKLTGHVLANSGSTLGLVKGSGTSFKIGGNYITNPSHPSTVVDPAINTSKIYRYYMNGTTPVIDTGVGAAGYSVIDPSQYVRQSDYTLQSVPSGQYSIQRVFWVPNSPTNAFLVYYGNGTYNSIANAVTAITTEPFSEAPNTQLNAIFVAYVVVKGNATNLGDTTQASIIQGGLFRNVNSIAGSTVPVVTSLSSLSDVSSSVASPTYGDLFMYDNTVWFNTKTLSGSYTITGNLNVTNNISASSITGSHFGTSSWSNNSLTASYLTPTNSYTGNAFTASNYYFGGSGNNVYGIYGGGNGGSASLVMNSNLNTYLVLQSQNGKGQFNVYRGNGDTYVGSISAGGNTYLGYSGSISGGGTYLNFSLNGNNRDFHVTYNNGPDLLSVNNSGFVGVGIATASNATARLHISGSNTNETELLIQNYIGTNLLVVSSSGNIGIGTNAPVNTLDVVGNISCSAITASNFFGTSSWSTNALTASYLTPTNSYTITNLTASNVSASNTVYTNIVSASNAISLTNNFASITATGAASAFSLALNSNQSATLTMNAQTPNVLIKSVANGNQSYIGSNSSGTNIFYGYSGSASGGGTYLNFSQNGTAKDFHVTFNNGPDLLSVNSNGYVGINVATASNATARLHISGSTANETELLIQNSSGTNLLVVSSSGNIGIGTNTPKNTLDIVGQAAIGSTYAGTNFAPTNGLIVQGNVGVGTTSPVNKLDVAGNISCSVITASLFSGSFSGSYFGTSSWSTNSLTASYLTPTNSYTITNLTASSISSSGTIIALNETLFGDLTFDTNTSARNIKATGGNGAITFGLNGTSTRTLTFGSFSDGIYFSQSININPQNATNIGLIGPGNQGSLYFTQSGVGSNDIPPIILKGTNGNNVGNPVVRIWDSGLFASRRVFGVGYNSPYTESLTVLNSGNVGVGTTNPVNALDVVGNISCSVITGSLFFGTSSWSSNSLTASSLVAGNSYIITNLSASGTITSSGMLINGNLTVTGSIFASIFSASNIYITSSTLTVTDNIITINALSPYQRYAGLAMYDSGSGTLSNFLWDSQNNYFFISSSDASASRQVILGPAGEASLTANYIPLISGSNNITSSVMYQSSSFIGVGTITPTQALDVTGFVQSSQGFYVVNSGTSLTATAIQLGNSAGRIGLSSTNLSYGSGGTTTSHNFLISGVSQLYVNSSGNTGIGTTVPVNKLDVAGNISASNITASLFFGTSSWSNNSLTASYVTSSNVIGTVTSASYALSSSYSPTNITSSWATQSLTSSYLVTANSYTITNLTASNISASGNISSSTSWINTATINNLTGSNIQLTGDISTANAKTISLTRTIPTTVGNEVDIGSFAITNGGANLDVFITVPSSNYSVSKRFIFSVQYNQTANTWTAVSPISSTGVYSGNDFALDANVNATALSLRLRNTAGTTAGTAYITIIYQGVVGDVFTSSTTTSSVSAPTTYLSSAPMTAVGGNVGIGTTNPGYKLEVVGNISASTFIGALTGTSSWAASSSNAVSSQTASYLTPTNSYTITNLTAIGNISASGTITASQLNVSNGNLSAWTNVAQLNAGNAGSVNAGAVITLQPASASLRYDGGRIYGGRWGTNNGGLRFAGILWSNSGSYGTENLTFDIDARANAFVFLTGSVGIGTPNPVNTLDVVGNISASIITASLFFGTSSWSSNSLTASYITASNVIGTVTSASYALSSSYSPTNITASWSTNSLTASYLTTTNSYQITNLTASNISASIFVGAFSGSHFGTSSWAQSSSNAINSQTASYLPVNTYQITSSWSNNSLTASYITASNVVGTVISASYALSSSYSLSSSYAPVNTNITASWSTNALTASYLTPANSYTITNLSASTITASNQIIYKNAVLLDYSSSALATSQSNYVILQNLTGSYNSAFFDYFASSASNFRAGTLIAGWSGSNITYAEYATTDVGNTNQLTMSAAISASYIQLLGNAASSLNWNIKSSGRYL